MANQTGLEQLDDRRKRAERQVPRPHHARAAVATTTAEPAGPAVADQVPTRPASAEVGPLPVTLAAAQGAETASGPASESVTGRQRARRFRQTQVLFDARADAHLTELKKRAVMADVDLSASGILRRALDEYVETHGYDGIVTWFAEHGRP